MSYLTFLGNFFGDRPDQYVEASEWEDFKNTIAIAVKDGTMTKSEGQEAMAKVKTFWGEVARKFVEKVEASIKLTPSDKVTNEPHKVKAVTDRTLNQTNNVREERIIGED